MCYHPNISIKDRNKWNANTGKNWQQVAFYNSWSKDFKGYEYYNEFNKNPSLNQNGKYRADRIPCYNKCIQCCEERAKEWATKCYLESLYHDENYMITFTYDDTHLPIKSEIYLQEYDKHYYDDGTWNGYLEYEDAKKVIHSIRDWQRYAYGNTGIKVFGCGEYGGKEGRPHFHIIFFGLHIDPEDVKVHSIDTQGNILYECEKIAKCWDYKGFVSIGECNWQTSRYVAGYVQKKQLKSGVDEYEFFTSKPVYYAKRGQTEEKLFMSNHPGIGKSFYEDHANKNFLDGYIYIHGAKQKIVKAKIPKYFERLMEQDCEDLYLYHKEKKQVAAERAEKVKMAQTSLTIKEQLEVEERIKKDKMLIFNLRDKVG